MSADIESLALAERVGYSFHVLTDGTLIFEPPPDPDCCGTCRARSVGAVDSGE